MNSLYEIRTGYVGESYVRAYAWADSPREAEQLFHQRNPKAKIGKLTVVTLMDDGARPFCTLESDSGWEMI